MADSVADQRGLIRARLFFESMDNPERPPTPGAAALIMAEVEQFLWQLEVSIEKLPDRKRIIAWVPSPQDGDWVVLNHIDKDENAPDWPVHVATGTCRVLWQILHIDTRLYSGDDEERAQRELYTERIKAAFGEYRKELERAST